jgi:TetR/AcrR family transcriptional repressor of nem operon
MRYAADHKPRARQQLLDAAASHAKTHGFAASGVDSLAAAAGLTSGALYKHFGGKAQLLAELVRSELQRMQQRYDALDADDSAAVSRMQAGYLSLQHARRPGQGCLLPPLAAEVARADDDTRQAFQQGLSAVHDSFQRLTQGQGHARDRRRRRHRRRHRPPLCPRGLHRLRHAAQRPTSCSRWWSRSAPTAARRMASAATRAAKTQMVSLVAADRARHRAHRGGGVQHRRQRALQHHRHHRPRLPARCGRWPASAAS